METLAQTVSRGVLLRSSRFAFLLVLSVLAAAVTVRAVVGSAGSPAVSRPAARSVRFLAELPSMSGAQISGRIGAETPRYSARREGDAYALAGAGVSLRLGSGSASVRLRGASLSLGALTIARGRHTAEVALGAPGAAGNRVEYRRAGVGEWFVAGPLGVEQGFTLSRRPTGVGSRVTLAVALSGSLQASAAGAGATLAVPGGRPLLRYSAPYATDARGRKIPVKLIVQHRRLEFALSDAGARYPLRIDPLVQAGPKLTGTEGTSFGYHVAISGDGSTALVSSYAPAVVWVFVRSGSTWTQQARLTVAKSEVFGDALGISEDGNTAVIDAETAFYIFERTGTSWAETAGPLVGSEKEGKFGYDDVAISGDGNTVIAGSGEDEEEHHLGAVWIFVREKGAWVQQGHKLRGSGEEAGPLEYGIGFGTAVALDKDGSTALVGGHENDSGVGAMWVFTRSASTWSQQGSKLVGAEDVGEFQNFGDSVALSSDGNTAIAGGIFDNGGIGAAWVFTRSGSSWSQQGPKLTGAGEVGNGNFGSGVALSGDGDTALVAGNQDDLAGAYQGAVWAYSRSGGAWSAQGPKATGSERAFKGSFGSSLALSADGTTALVGNPSDTVNGGVWVFSDGSTVSISGANVPEPASGSATANFGVKLSSPSTSVVSVEYETVDGSGPGGAHAPGMYETAKGTLTFQPGETTQTIPVTVLAAGFSGARTFTVKLSNPEGASLGTAVATGTIVGPSPLQVTVAISPAEFEVEQNEAGAVPVRPTATVTVKDVSPGPIENVALPANLTIGWHGPAPINALPVKQVAGPEGAKLKLGTLEPGESAAGQYTLQVEGDGQFDVESLVTGSEEGQTVSALGKATIEPTSQQLVVKNTLGAEVHSPTNPSLIKAGTHFLVKVKLENRSFVNRLQVEGLEPALSGNALGGALVPQGQPTTFEAPTGAISEVFDSPIVVMKPRESREFNAVVGTTASSAFASGGGGGGTRATVAFGKPEVSTLDEADETTPVEDSRVVLTPGSGEFPVGIDDSAPAPPPASFTEAVWSVAKGVGYGLWGLTYGTVRGFVDLAGLAGKTVLQIPGWTLNEMDHMVELWAATESDPDARRALILGVIQKIEEATTEAPTLIAKLELKLGTSLYNAVNNAVGQYFTKIAVAWDAGDWRDAVTDVADTSTNVLALLGPVALKVAPGVLVRLAPVADAWAAGKAAAFAKIDDTLQAATKLFEPAVEAVNVLRQVKPGYIYKIPQLATFFGMGASEADWLAEFCKLHDLSIIFRSRAAESLEWLKEGAMLKPYWIKAKNVSWLDVEFFGFNKADVGRVVLKRPPTFAALESRLEVQGVKSGTPEYAEVIERWQELNKTYDKELSHFQEWNKQKEIKGKWPWKENGVNPAVQADEELSYKFRLRPDPKDPGALVPEIWNPKARKWGSVTGDIDLIAITKANGEALDDLEHVGFLKLLRKSPLGSQHPESLTWTLESEPDPFWFAKKRKYLAETDLVQAAPDGKFRAVKFDEALSEPTKWTKLAYRVFWDGGYKTGPGQ